MTDKQLVEGCKSGQQEHLELLIVRYRDELYRFCRHLTLNRQDAEKLSMKSGETISIDYKSKVEEGQLSMKLYGPDNQVLTELATNESGTEKVKAGKDGKYRIEIKGEDTKGSFKVAFNVE